MACCIVAALLLALIRRVAPGRRGDLDAGFAPQAMRPAPGARANVCTRDPRPQSSSVTQTRHTRTAWVAIALGVAAVEVMLIDMHVLGVHHVPHGVHTAVYGVAVSTVAIGVLLLSRTQAAPHSITPQPITPQPIAPQPITAEEPR